MDAVESYDIRHNRSQVGSRKRLRGSLHGGIWNSPNYRVGNKRLIETPSRDARRATAGALSPMTVFSCAGVGEYLFAPFRNVRRVLRASSHGVTEPARSSSSLKTSWPNLQSLCPYRAHISHAIMACLGRRRHGGPGLCHNRTSRLTASAQTRLPQLHHKRFQQWIRNGHRRNRHRYAIAITAGPSL